MAVQRDKIIASAEKLVAKGKVEAAIKEYERLLDDNPNDVNTLNRIGDLWVRINRNDEAVKVFGRIADHYSKDGFFLKAIAIYKKINKLDPSKLDVYAKLADLYAKQGLAMEAKSQYQVLADYYTKHGDPANALATFRKISELDPNSINVHVKLADLYSQNNQTAEALKEYDRVGRMLLKRGMLDEAVQVFRKALKIDATNLELVESLTTALFDAKDFENAAKILETSLEKNRENPRLLSLLGRAFIGRGDMVGATDVLERGLYSNPTDASIRDSLAEVYLRQGAVDRAFDLLVPLIDSALSRGEGKAAVDLVNRVLKLDPHNIPALHKLVSVHTKLKQETSILSAMNNLAEAHIAERQYADAASVLNDLLQREPENAQHREKLALVQQRLGGAAAAPQPAAAPPRPAEPPPKRQPAPAAPPPPPPPSIVEEQPADFTIDLDSSSALELDLSFMPEPAAKPEPLRHAPSPRSISDAFAIPTPEMEEEEEDLDFITEHLTEAEVFAKYGLSEKAIEHCRAVLDRFPKNLAGHEKLLRVYLDEGDADQIRKTSDRYLQLLDEAGDTETASAVRNELVERGYLEPSVDEASFSVAMEEASEVAGAGLVDVETISPAVESFMNPVAGVEPEPEEVTLDFATEVEEVAEIEFDIEEATLAEEAVVSPAVEEPLPEETFEMPSVEESFDLPEVTAESLVVDETLATPEPEFETPKDVSLPELDFVPPEEPLEVETISENALEFDLTAEEPAFETPALEIPEPESVAESLPADAFDLAAEVPELSVSEPSFSGAGLGSIEPEPEFGETDFTSPAALDPAPEELGEIDFYIGQELFEEARKRIDALAQRFPASQEIASRRGQIERAPAPVASAPPAPTDLSADLIESELLTALPEEDDIHIIAAPRAPQPVVPAVDESNLFAEEDDFFDLAAELEEELEQEEATVSLSDEEQSLEEIFREFKKGVEQQLDSEDYDTHYNLGIAYKEMGLIDEAIGEFQLASKDPKRTIECCSMLGLCFLEKGMPQLAIKWYGKGLEVPEISEDEHLGLLYDLALVYLEVGDVASAQKAFVEIYGMNSNYRDVVNRIKQLEDVRN